MSIRKGEELIAITPDKIDVVNNQSDNTGLKFWTGTKTEYDAIEVKDSNTLYNVIDDTDVTLNLLNVLYPVGSLYLTTTSTCPLATLGVGTWQLEATDRVLQGAGSRGSVGTTIDESLPNITAWFDTGDRGFNLSSGGAMVNSATRSGYAGSVTSTGARNHIDFNASLSSSTYQDNAPVQQDAYLINVYRRIA